MFGVFHRLRHGCRRVFAAPEWPDFAGADWPDTILGVAVTDRYFAKQGRSIGRWTVEHGVRKLVVYLKRHYQLPRWQGLLAALLPGQCSAPGWGEFHNLRIAANLGIPVPRVLAAAEYVRPGGQLQSMLAVEELAGMAPLHEAIPLASRHLSAKDFARWKRGLIAELARLARLLHDDHWFHKDLYLCHLYVPEADILRPPATWVGRVHMIDFHRLQRHTLTSPWWQAKDIGQLLYSSDVEGVTPRDRLRFWKLYTKDRSGWLWFVRGTALVRARNHRGHNERNPQTSAKAA